MLFDLDVTLPTSESRAPNFPGTLSFSFGSRDPALTFDVLCEKDASDGVVGVALLDLEVGNIGNALSCGRDRSGEGGLVGNGEVVLRKGGGYGDLRPLPEIAGDALREFIEVFDECRAGGGGFEWRNESSGNQSQ